MKKKLFIIIVLTLICLLPSCSNHKRSGIVTNQAANISQENTLDKHNFKALTLKKNNRKEIKQKPAAAILYNDNSLKDNQKDIAQKEIVKAKIQKKEKQKNIISNNKAPNTQGINIPIINIQVDDPKAINPLKTDKASPTPIEKPIFMDNTLSIKCANANTSKLCDYKEKHYNVFNYTYDMVSGCWNFTPSENKGFYLYSMHDEGNDSKYHVGLSKMRRCYLEGGFLKEEYLDTKDVFYEPYEDKDGNIYAECGRDEPWQQISNDKLFIKKMNSKGKTLSKICVGGFDSKQLNYFGFAYIKKDTIALLFHRTAEDAKQITVIQIIDMRYNQLLRIINIYDDIVRNTKSDDSHFIIPSASYQKVYVFDANTFQLVNTIDTTKCKEICAYELEPYCDNDFVYNKLGYDLYLKNDKIYFLRHSGIYYTDLMKSNFYQLLDGNQYKDFLNQNYIYTSFCVGEDEDFYILGVAFDEESATELWQYKKAK